MGNPSSLTQEVHELRKLIIRSAVSAGRLLSIAALVGWLLMSISNGYAPAIGISSAGVLAFLLPIPVWLSRRASPHTMRQARSRTNGTLKKVWRPYR